MSTATQAVPTAFALGVREMFLQQLEKEVCTTKRVLSLIPDDKRDWRPEPKARTARELAEHIAWSDVAFLEGIAAGTFADLMAEEKAAEGIAALPKKSSELGDWYQKHANAALAKIRKLTGDDLIKIIDFYGAFQLPAFAYLMFVNNHSVHHRGQLATYLRPMGSICPDIYGGSADEPWQG